MKKVLFAILLLILFGCGKEKGTETDTKQSNTTVKEKALEKENNSKTYETGELFTEKLIKNFYLDLEDNELIIEFYEAQNKNDFNGSKLLSFSPDKISGKYRWKDDHTLIYEFSEVDKSLTYKANFSLKEYLKKDYKDLSFYVNFDVPKITDFSMRQKVSGDSYYVEVYLTFNKNISSDFINSNLKLSLPKNGKAKNLQIAQIVKTKNSERRYTLISSKFKEDIDRQSLQLNFFGQTFEEFFSYNNIPGVSNYEFREKNDKFTLYVKLNTYSIDSKDLKSYININGLDEFYVKNVNDTLIINGDFISGKEYEIRLFSPLAQLKKDEIFKVKVPNLQPKIEFKNNGIYLADSENKNLRIRTRNLRGVKLSVKKVDSGNIDYFVDYYGIESGTEGKSKYDEYSLLRFGTELYSEKVKFDEKINTWVERDIDLSMLGEKYGKKGIYLVEAAFDSSDIMVPIRGYENGEYTNDAYKNYGFADYIYSNGYISKTVLLSNIGIITKKTDDRLFVYTSDIVTGKALENTEIKVLTNGGELKSFSNEDGVAIFNLKEDNWTFIFAEKDGELSFINKYNNYINYYSADNSGIDKKSGLNAYLYTERGVYRPGDNIYISTVIFEENKKLPQNIPLKLKIFNPMDKLYTEIKGENKGNNLYTFSFATDSSDITGNWRAELYTGDLLINNKYIKVETIVPPVIKVKNELSMAEKKVLKVDIQSDYLFGAPGKNLEYNCSLDIRLAANPFTAYKTYSFVNETLQTSDYNNQTREGFLNEDGKGEESFEIDLFTAPFKLELLTTTDVFQKDGRKVSEADSIVFDLYNRYAGIESFDAYGQIGEKVELGTILLDKDGNVLEGNLEYNIYRNENYWWWDYSSYESYRQHYKKSDETILIENGKVKAGDKIAFSLEDYGDYYVEVIDSEGHRAGSFVKSGYYGYGDNNNSDSFIKLGTNKEEFNEGDTVEVSFEADTDSYAIINIEQKNEILKSVRVQAKKGTNTYSFPAEKSFFPGVYVNVIVLQNLKDKLSDNNIKLQGLKYIKIKNENKKIEASIEAEPVYKDSTNIKVKIKTSLPNASFTLAAVDEGLLSITRFKSPNVYNYFYGKERYGIFNYDNYRHIININKDKAYEVLTPGGGEYRLMGADEVAEQKSDKGVNDPKRFKAISYFKAGKTNENGEATINFEMEEYMGELRFMLVAVKDGAFGNAESKSKVRGDIVMFPGLPRKIAPEDSIVSNLNIFINEIKDSVGKVGIKVEGPIEIIGDSEFDMADIKEGEYNFQFKLKALKEIGNAKISYYFKSENASKENSVDIEVDSQAPFFTYTDSKELNSMEETAFTVNNEAIKNSSLAYLRISRFPTYNLYGRLQYLIRYPYGCLEQTVSSVFPQLYISKFIDLGHSEWMEINENVNEGIKRLEKFKLPNGSLSYWQNEQYSDYWSTNYAHYFLIEAAKKGYYVPKHLIDGLNEFQYIQAGNTRDVSLVNMHRLYILALGGNAHINAMNYYKQNSLKNMTNTEKFLLAGAYSIIGYTGTAEYLIKDIDFEIKDSYWEDNFGSDLRDKAIILDVISRLKKDEKSSELNSEILEKLSGKDWYSTQTLAYSLIAVSNYRENDNMQGDISYEYTLDGETHKKTLKSANESIYLENAFGKEVKIKNLSNDKLYVNYVFDGQMDLREQKAYAKELRLKSYIYDEDGNPIDNLSNLQKGQSIWLIYKLNKQSNKRYKNMALAQNLASGLEIENLRLSGKEYPQWVYNIIGNEAYSRNVDIRDDRMVWFFDSYYGNTSYFVLKLNAVTPGEYFMPGATVEAMYSDTIGSSTEGMDVKIK